MKLKILLRIKKNIYWTMEQKTLKNIKSKKKRIKPHIQIHNLVLKSSVKNVSLKNNCK